MKAFVIDVSLCNGCYCCQIACKDEHVGNDWSPYARPQPDTGQFWIKLNEYIQGTVPKVKMHYIPVICMHCEDAPCISSCPVTGAIYRRDDGLVIIDPEKCTGCRNCVDACPYGTIFMNEGLNIAQKCTGCAHLLDDDWKEPRCVDVCPTQAIRFGEETDLTGFINKAGALKPEASTKPRVHYLNIPGKFIAGTVIDPAKKEVVINASCELSNMDSGKKHTTSTDSFGDFWFENLETGKYSLNIEKAGKTRKLDSLDTQKSINLGELTLS